MDDEAGFMGGRADLEWGIQEDSANEQSFAKNDPSFVWPGLAVSRSRESLPPSPKAKPAGPPMGASIASLMLWRAQTADSGAANVDEWRKGITRRSWLSKTPLSTKRNPPRIAFSNTLRSFQDPRNDTAVVQSHSVSSAGLSWHHIDAINQRVIHSAPSIGFPTEERRLCLTQHQERVAKETPASNEYQQDSTQITALSTYKRGVTPRFSFSGRPPVVVQRSSKGGISTTYGEREVNQEIGIDYTSLGEQRLSTSLSTRVSAFPTTKRVEMADTRDFPGPGDYQVLIKQGAKKDVLQRTRERAPSQFSVPKSKRPWQHPIKKIDQTVLDQHKLGYLTPEALSQHRNAPAISIGAAIRHGCELLALDDSPSPATYDT